MKKHLLLTSAAMLLSLAALATPAAADIDVRGFIEKDAEIRVTETVLKTKTVDITVTQNFLGGDSAAEATGVHNQRTSGNILNRDCTGCVVGRDPPAGTGPVGPGGLQAIIGSFTPAQGSFNGNTGLVLWNQDVGANVNQANVVTAAVVSNADFAEAFNAAAQITENNQSFVRGFVVGPPATLALIANSVNNSTGVTMLNQNSGFASNQYNSLALGFGVRGASVALAEADLGQWNTNNVTFEVNSIRISSIQGSVNNNTGLTAVNQNSGNYNNQATMISIAGGLGNRDGGVINGLR